MIRSTLSVAFCAVATLLGGCLISSHEHFDMRKGVEVPLPDGVYACSVEKDPVREAPPRMVRAFFHTTAFQGRIALQKVSGKDGVRYLITEEDDPSLATVHAFHRVAGDVFAYTTPVDLQEKNKGAQRGYATWLVQITESTIAPLQVEDSAKVRDFAAMFGVRAGTDRAGPDYFAMGMEGTQEDERRFIQALATSNLLAQDSVCSRVVVPATK